MVFIDVGSTELGERLDPEVLRRVMTTYLERMRRVLERHGGHREKYIGDAVVRRRGNCSKPGPRW